MLLENLKFWESIDINDLNLKKNSLYMFAIKSLVRIELLKIIKENFNDQCIFVGNDLKILCRCIWL